MKARLLATAACLGAAGIAQAGGIDRSGQGVDLIFQDGNYAEVSITRTLPNVSGDDLEQDAPLSFLQGEDISYDDVARNFDMIRFGLKYDVTEKLSLIFTSGEDYGVDVVYPDSTGSLLGGTKAQADSNTLSLIGRYKFDDTFSVHAGVRRQTASGEILLNGLAYGGPTTPTGGGVSGYNVDLDSDTGYGYLIGGAYERKDIALRVAVTYFSEIEHEFDTTETFAVDINSDFVPDLESEFDSGKTKVKTPRAVNLDFQTGIMEDTLLFGQVRWVDHSQFKVEPERFKGATGRGLVTLDDSTTYTLGLGRKFTEDFSGSIAYIYDDVDGDDLVSPLAPTHGSQALRLAGKYQIGKVDLIGGLRYTWLGDAKAQTADTARADFSGNDALSVGIKVGYRF